VTTARNRLIADPVRPDGRSMRVAFSTEPPPVDAQPTPELAAWLAEAVTGGERTVFWIDPAYCATLRARIRYWLTRRLIFATGPAAAVIDGALDNARWGMQQQVLILVPAEAPMPDHDSLTATADLLFETELLAWRPPGRPEIAQPAPALAAPIEAVVLPLTDGDGFLLVARDAASFDRLHERFRRVAAEHGIGWEVGAP
jgi:hypothetical protein